MLKKNSEVRIAGAEPETSESSGQNQSVGDSDRAGIEDHKTRIFGGGAKTPIIHPLFRSEYLSCILTTGANIAVR